MLLGWVLLSLFVIAGSIWGYEENWSGFWAWDPVEIASVVMWFVVTLYFHAKNHVPENHPLRSILAAMGWVAVTFSAFIVRSGLLEGLHTYAESRENLILSFVFGFLLLGTALGLYLAIRGANMELFPEQLLEWKNHPNKVQFLTFWSLAFGSVINTLGLLVQLANAVITGDTNTPFVYYIFLNGITLFALVILLAICELRLHKWSDYEKIVLFGFSGIIMVPLMYFILGHNILAFALNAIMTTVLLALLINFGRTLYTKYNIRKISISIVHISIILMIISYFSVDYSSNVSNEILYCTDTNRGCNGNEVDIKEFDLTLNFTHWTTNQALTFHIDVLDSSGDKLQTVELTQGDYKGEKWIFIFTF
jgi:cytochrome c biogenesis factor